MLGYAPAAALEGNRIVPALTPLDSFQATVSEVLASETTFLLNLWIDRFGDITDTFSQAVPEPESAILMATGISGLAYLGRRRGRRRI
jgi:hypothetical protein